MNLNVIRKWAAMAVLMFGWSVFSMAQEIQMPINQSTGKWTVSNEARTWAKQWTSNSTSPVLTLSCAANNMAFYGDGGLKMYTGNDKVQYSADYTISVSPGYEIVGYGFTFVTDNAGKEIVITPRNQDPISHKGTGEAAKVSVPEIRSASAIFNIKHARQSSDGFALVSDLVVTVRKMENTPTVHYLFKTNYGDIPYRIPAVACTKSGKLLAFSDYRPCMKDIGYGDVDIKLRKSTDHGLSWTAEETIADGTGVSGAVDCGFGDAAVVADRESEEVLMLCVAGNTIYHMADYTQNRPNVMLRFVSRDGGDTWDEYKNLTEDVYGLFKNSVNGPIKSMFVGSGKLCQSSTIKAGTHYRVYAPVCARDGGNRVLYSDDFGLTWKVLGGIDALPIPGGDEPKCEELPDGRILLSSRTTGGRFFNIWSYANATTAEGSWSTMAKSDVANGGIIAEENSCNGEIMILPVKRNEDGEQMYLALHSVPFGPQRSNVGIYYKPLRSLNDYINPESLAKDWTGKKQISFIGSAYSTMVLQGDEKIGFFYEETTYGGEYTNVYRPLSVEEITDSAYSYDRTVPKPSANEQIIAAADLEEAETLLRKQGLGYPSADAPARIALQDICKQPANYKKTELVTAVDNYVKEAKVDMPQEEQYYTFTVEAKNGSEFYLDYEGGMITLKQRSAGTELPATAQYKAKMLADGNWAFSTKDGKYLSYLTKTPGPNWLSGYSTNCVTEQFADDFNTLTLEKAFAGAKTDVSDARQLMGKFYVRSLRGYRTDNHTRTVGYWVVKTSAMIYDGANEPYLNNDFSSLFRLEKVTLPLGKAVTSLADVDPNKVYALYNEHFTTYAIKKEKNDNVWAANMTEDADHKLSNMEFRQPFDADSPYGGWQLVTDQQGNHYLYNVGAGQYARTPDTNSACTFVNEKMPIRVTQLSGGLAFNTNGGYERYFCAAPQLAGAPISVWTSSDKGSKWILKENPNIKPAASIVDYVTGIQHTEQRESKVKGIYTLSGQRLNTSSLRDLRPGVYIVNGRKCLVSGKQ